LTHPAPFEIGADSGDAAGEFPLWHERQTLDVRDPFACYILGIS
jgi:hypothetical protein